MTPKEKEDYENEYTDNIRGIREHQAIGFEYLLHGFRKGIERRFFTGLSIQSTPDGAFKGFIKSTKVMADGSEFGFICYTTSEDVAGILEYFETGIAYDDLSWREDKYFNQPKEEIKEDRKNRKKLKLA